MSRFSEEFSVIPRTGKVIAFLIWLALTAGLIVTFSLTKPGDPPLPLKVLFPVLVPLPLTAFALAAGYVYGDARRRGMRHVMWTLLAIFIPNAIGVILYFIFREPLPLLCPSCGAGARRSFAFCPECGQALQNACPACRKAVETQWVNCAYCGVRLGS